MDIKVGLFITSMDYVLVVYIVWEYIRNFLLSSFVIPMRFSLIRLL